MGNERKDVAGLVIQDIEHRIAMGAEKYGERLTTNNGRNALIDAYQEVLDLAVYLRQKLTEDGIDDAHIRLQADPTETEPVVIDGLVICSGANGCTIDGHCSHQKPHEPIKEDDDTCCSMDMESCGHSGNSTDVKCVPVKDAK